MRRILLALLLLSAPAAAEPARRQMIVTAHPLATEAGLAMLRTGGTAVDAAVAAALVLSVVEPHASGLGGGGVLLAWDQGRGALGYFEGISSAPAGVGDRLLAPGEQGTPAGFAIARGGRAAAVPGSLAMLGLAHAKAGALPWATLFAPAIRAAEDGFRCRGRCMWSCPAARPPMPRCRRCARCTSTRPASRCRRSRRSATRSRPRRCAPWPRVAPRRCIACPLAEAIVAAVAASPHPGTLTLADLAGTRRRNARRCVARPSAGGSAPRRRRPRAASRCCSSSACWSGWAMRRPRRARRPRRICCWRRAAWPPPTAGGGAPIPTWSRCRRRDCWTPATSMRGPHSSHPTTPCRPPRPATRRAAMARCRRKPSSSSWPAPAMSR